MQPLQITLSGHLTQKQLQQEFDKIEAELETSSTRRGLVVNCIDMTGYDITARSTFVDWNRQWRSKITRVAIVTDNLLWHMVIKMMARMSTQEMKDFKDLGAARAWLHE